MKLPDEFELFCPGDDPIVTYTAIFNVASNQFDFTWVSPHDNQPRWSSSWSYEAVAKSIVKGEWVVSSGTCAICDAYREDSHDYLCSICRKNNYG